jgi:hypothetical protein
LNNRVASAQPLQDPVDLVESILQDPVVLAQPKIQDPVALAQLLFVQRK